MRKLEFRQQQQRKTTHDSLKQLFQINQQWAKLMFYSHSWAENCRDDQSILLAPFLFYFHVLSYLILFILGCLEYTNDTNS